MNIIQELPAYPWFALQTRARYESFVAKQLAGKGYELFFPFYRTKRRWSDRMQELDVPLFPGYLFCRLNPHDRLPILMTAGVIQIVGVGKTPVPVDEDEMKALQKAVNTGLPRQPWPFLRVGEKVQVEAGPLCGLEGVLLSFKGRYRLVLSLSLLQRSVAVEVEADWVTPVARQHAQPVAAVSSPPYQF